MFLTATATESASRLDLFVGTGLPTLLIGMLAVFAILGIIFLALVIMRASFKRNAIKAKKARKAEEAKKLEQERLAEIERLKCEKEEAQREYLLKQQELLTETRDALQTK